MKHTVYKITNLINSKTYIGKHQTLDPNDNYYGSGKYITNALSKYGKENFKKDVLYIFETEEEMNAKEKELVTEEFCLRKDTYNLCKGGNGGFSYINRVGLKSKVAHIIGGYSTQKKLKGTKNQQLSETLRKMHKNGIHFGLNSFKGKRHSFESKRKMSDVKRGQKIGPDNSQYGTRWITDGIESKKIKIDAMLPFGWHYGRANSC